MTLSQANLMAMDRREEADEFREILKPITDALRKQWEAEDKALLERFYGRSQ